MRPAECRRHPPVALQVDSKGKGRDLPHGLIRGDFQSLRMMNPNPVDNVSPEVPKKELDEVTRGMVRERATQLAGISGRLPHEISLSDWEEAKRELNADPDIEL